MNSDSFNRLALVLKRWALYQKAWNMLIELTYIEVGVGKLPLLLEEGNYAPQNSLISGNPNSVGRCKT